MSRLSGQDKNWLEEKFANRVSFDPSERVLYGHDIAAVPGLFKPVLGNTTPAAVVQPESEAELSELMTWADAARIPLVPRGKSTSGYGGVIPARGGVVVDFYRMKNVLAVDAAAGTVTVEPGITWEKLDEALKPKGLTLRLYPTSYPSSSVGGWLAQGGAGIGSYEFGWFQENVVSARVVLPSGEARELSGPDLDLVSDAEGTTGFISRVTLNVMKLEELGLTAIACPDAHKLTTGFQGFISRDLPIWSVVFINPRMAEMKNRAPVRMHQGHPAEHKVILPAAYVAVLAYKAADRDKVVSQLPEILHDCQGMVLSQEIADHEWENRSKLMVVKRLGPSLVPAEVVVPLENLGGFMEDIEHLINQPIVKEGVVVKRGRDGKPEAVILGFIPSDQRKFSYNFVFGLVLSVVKVAERHGGRPYSTGIYFIRKAQAILGGERPKRLKAFKKEVDKRGILNPGKVIEPNRVSRALGFAGIFEPLIRPFGNTVVTQGGAGCWRGFGSRSSAPAGTPWPPGWARGWTSRFAALRAMSPGTRTPAPSAATASTNVTSSTDAAGRANHPAANGTGFASSWKDAPTGTRKSSTPSWSARPASSVTSAARRPSRSSRVG